MRYGKRVSGRWGSKVTAVLALVMILVGPMGFLTDQPVYAADAVWRAEFYNNTWLGGTPVLVRNDSDINFDFGSGSPAAGVNADDFSIRWTRSVSFNEGDYQFTVTVDDGARLWVDGDLIIDKWFDQAAATYTATRTMSGGDHYLRLEYYENTGVAVIRLSWAPLGVFPTAWHGEFYANMFLSGAPALVRDDPTLDFHWGPNSPGSPIPSDYFSVRWTRIANFPTAGNYTFYATHDDGIRVWVDNQLIIDKWFATAEVTDTATVYLAAGDHSLRVEYFEQTGVAVAALTWQLSGAAPPPPTTTTVIVDDLSANFFRFGPLSSFRSTTCGYQGHSFWTLNDVYNISNSAKWIPVLPQAGQYDVYVFIPRCNATTTNACYKIVHAGMTHFVSVNQLRYSDVFVKLGRFTFNATGNEYVFLGDATGEAYLSHKVNFDAVKFVLVQPSPPPPPPTTCSIIPVLGFGNVWNNNASVRNKIGCALQPEMGIVGAQETFIGGLMFFLQNGPTIYAVYNDGTWQSFPDTWAPPQPESDPSIVPPAGFFQPVRGFGKVWRDNATVRAKLSWATESESGVTLSWEPFQHGQMIYSPRFGVYVLFDDGTWRKF